MMNKRGFTLTEILLAVMIVGLIGLSLAALTTAASREAGVGRSKVLMRNNLSLALRTLRADLNEASRLTFVRGILPTSTSTSTLLKLEKNVSTTAFNGLTDLKIMTMVHKSDKSLVTTGAQYITYCFVPGTMTTKTDGDVVYPTGANIGGTIHRTNGRDDYVQCNNNSPLWLKNVKYIPSAAGYPVPLFCLGLQCAGADGTNRNAANLLTVRVITELDSTPAVNDVIEEVFAVPNGF